MFRLDFCKEGNKENMVYSVDTLEIYPVWSIYIHLSTRKGFCLSMADVLFLFVSVEKHWMKDINWVSKNNNLEIHKLYFRIVYNLHSIELNI